MCESRIMSSILPPGLNEHVVRSMSLKRREPSWLLDWRLAAFAHWKTLEEPHWMDGHYDPIDYQSLSYFSDPTQNKPVQNPSLLEVFEKLGVPVHERALLSGQRPVAVDAVLDSVSVATTYRQELATYGILFCSMQDAVRDYPDLVRTHLGQVVSHKDNFFAALNAAVFSDGSFCYIPRGVSCPMDLSTYFRLAEANTGQFERTLIVAEEGSTVSYLEGCSAPARPNHQLHAAVVEIVAMADSTVHYSTVQNWYPGDEKGRGGILNFVTKRADLVGDRSRMVWTQVETGSAITWKYPSCVLRGADSVGEFYSVSVTKNHQQADTGTKMIHLGPRTRSRIVAKSIASDSSTSTYRGLVRMGPHASDAVSTSQCDGLLMSDACHTHTLPTHHHLGPLSAHIEHEATTTRLREEALHYLAQRGIDSEEAVALMTNSFCAEVFQRLPMEFAVEANRLLSLKLEGAIG
jgi:Fe-S cluster assembly protein SufB